jgi:tetratricopeptide (TPR) repeat protein
VNGRSVLRVFISSTAVDLRDYRDKVRDAVLRMENLPVAMETFSAMSGHPASECIRMAAEADAVICIVAYRYGYVPPKELGGDSERSITWLEVDAAKRAGKPVFAFLVDPKAPWTGFREETRLISEPGNSADVVKAVQKLQEFKTYLERETTRALFSGDEELAKHVAITLANFAQKQRGGPASKERIWKPLFCHALQPAPHFRGREARLKELKEWLESPVTPDRILSVVAPGGTGKTAFINRALQDAKHTDRAGLFVWSFYAEPDTKAFLRAAYLYFSGEKEPPTGGLLEHLQIMLSGDTPHVLVFDGMERVQSEGGFRRRGELEDLQLKRLLGSLASSGNTRALVTSRFPLIDLENLVSAGHRIVFLDDLERPVALEVLRAWRVKGDDFALTQLLQPLNVNDSYHALSVAVLASYIANFSGGDPERRPEFSLREAAEIDPKAVKLHRILDEYAKALTPVERDILARLSLFPRGARIQFLGWMAQAGVQVAGAMIGIDGRKLVNHLERLKDLGLIFSDQANSESVYSAHPFVRDFFRRLLTAKEESFHETVRAQLALSLEARPDSRPTDPFILDQYEFLIEQSLLAGRIQEAYDLYWYGLGAYAHLGWILGDFARGLRILERFIPNDHFLLIERSLRQDEPARLVNALGLFAAKLGNLDRARRAFALAFDLSRAASNSAEGSIWSQNLADVEMNAGRFPKAILAAQEALSLAIAKKDEFQAQDSRTVLALAEFGLGRVESLHILRPPIGCHTLYCGAEVAECNLLRGDRSAAREQAEAHREYSLNYGYGAPLCRSDALMSRILLSDNPVQSARHLQGARQFANRSGVVELQLRCFRAACDLQLHLKNHTEALAEARAGILLADTCGFGRFSIDLRIVFAEVLLSAGNPHEALQSAREALHRSEQPECGYAWGMADGLHLCGVAHLGLGERELARRRLSAALKLREQLGHAGVEETRRAVDRLGDS